MTQDQAIAFCRTKWWEALSDRDIAEFQLQEPRLCMPFDHFQEAVEKALGRSVWTHEFANPEALHQELWGLKPKRTMQEILELIPAEKRVVIVLTKGETQIEHPTIR